MLSSDRYLRSIVATAATLWVLMAARSVLLPFVLALFLWFVFGATAGLFRKGLARAGMASPLLANLTAGLAVLGAVIAFGGMLVSSASEFAAALPAYERRLDVLLSNGASAIGLDAAFRVSDLLTRFDLTRSLIGLAGSAAAAVSSLVIIIAYLIFIRQESGAFTAKLAAAVADAGRRESVAALLGDIVREIERYMGVRVLLGVIQAVPTYLVLVGLGVSAPAFWAAVVFVVSFIPTVGTLVGIIFPALMTLLQFESVEPFFTVVVVLVPIQLLASNLLEPVLLSRSLNISPLVVLLGIFAGGAVWGIVGALVIVPILAICIIVCSQVPSVQHVAILLSSDGRLYRRPS